jgi:hypothetical protein
VVGRGKSGRTGCLSILCSHSNYAARAGPGGITLKNPIGLGRHWNLPLFDLRTRIELGIMDARRRSEIPDWDAKILTTQSCLSIYPQDVLSFLTCLNLLTPFLHWSYMTQGSE